jgi:hypothetical protein
MTWIELTATEKADQTRAAVEIEGLTYAQAAARFGTTRVAIAGVVKRNGIATKNQPSVVPKKRVKATGKRHQGIDRLVSTRPALTAETKWLDSPAWRPLEGVPPIALEDHTDGCRWPVGARLYCNATVAGEHTYYCAAHHRVAHPMRVM